MKKAHNILCTILPQRVVMGLMGFLAIAVAYTIRACLSVAIVEMVVPTNQAGKGDIAATTSRGKRYDWSEGTQGWVLSSFYIGYVITHIPGGLLAQRFGGKWTMAIGILFMAVLNAVTPLAVEYGGYIALIILRTLMGLGGGTTYPALSVMLAAWIPLKERGKLGSVVFGGGQIGSLVSSYFSGLILANFAWDYVFYFWSIICLIWFVLFIFTCYNDPGSHPFITEKEKAYLEREMGQTKRDDDLPPTPWMAIFTSVPVIALTFAQLGHDWVFYIISSYLPKYLSNVLHLPVKEVGLYSGITYLSMWIVSLVSGFISDFLIVRNYLSITNARKVFTTLGAVPPAIFIISASYAGLDKVPVVILFTLAVGFLGNFYPGLKVNALDLSPNYAGSLMALTNGIGGLTGIGVPPLVGWMTPDSSLDQWRVVWWITFGVSIVRIIIFIIWGSAEVQTWNSSTKFMSPESGLSSNQNRQNSKQTANDSSNRY